MQINVMGENVEKKIEEKIEMEVKIVEYSVSMQ